MSKRAAEHHRKASEHLKHAARHHEEAVKHQDAGHYEKVAHHAHTARGHMIHGRGHAEEAAKAHTYGGARQEVIRAQCRSINPMSRRRDNAELFRDGLFRIVVSSSLARRSRRPLSVCAVLLARRDIIACPTIGQSLDGLRPEYDTRRR